MRSLKLTSVGDSTGLVLPRDVLEHLHVNEGDILHVVETPTGIELTSDPAFAQQLEIAEQVMREDRDVLRKLAQ